MDSEWKELFDRVQVATGMAGEDEGEPLVKIQCSGNPRAGAKVKIQWKPYDESERDEFPPMIDEGYLLVMPGIEDDALMSGIVHIPKPVGGEKGDCEPEWHTLYDLERNPLIDSIEIIGG